MNADDLEKRLLRHIRRSDYRPVKPRVIAEQLGLPSHRHAELKKVIKQLAKTGQLTYAANHLVQPPQGPRGDEVLGTFRRHLSGYGFVRPLGTRKSAGRDDDLFIPAHKTRDAASGDLVRVKTSDRRGRGGSARRSGEILEVVERANSQFVGTYFLEAGLGLVQVDGSDFPLPIVVGDPGAKTYRSTIKSSSRSCVIRPRCAAAKA